MPFFMQHCARLVSDGDHAYGVPAELAAMFDRPEYTLVPGFCDVHVHFREPGFAHKETIFTGARAAARGGYTDVCAMPNLDPVPDSVEHLAAEQERIRAQSLCAVHPYAAITLGERGETISDMRALAAAGAVAFSDDGKGVQSAARMEEAMRRCAELGYVLAAHCEDESLLTGGSIHDGATARAWGVAGISSDSEWRPIARDLELAARTGCRYHVCHVSAAQSVSLIREAKKSGVDVTCETAPHYLLLDDSMLRPEGRFKMNPPLRAPADREALVEGICDGTIDMIATDHAPHTAAEKARGLDGPFGVVGLETAFPALWTGLVLPGVLTAERLVELLTTAPRRRFGIPEGDDFSVWDLNHRYAVDPAEFCSMGRATPFEGREVYGRCLLTVRDGRVTWMEKI